MTTVGEGELRAGDAIAADLGGRPGHGVSVRLVSDAMLSDHSLSRRALAAPRPIDSLRAQTAELMEKDGRPGRPAVALSYRPWG